MKPILQGIIGAAGAFLSVSLLFLLLHRRCRRRTKHPPPLPHGPHPSLSSDESSASFDPALRRVSMQDLIRATNSFDPSFVIGDGSFGLVYKASLSSALSSSSSSSSTGTVLVALKKLDTNAFQGQREFRAEMETLGRLRHPNLARLLGYCASGPDRVLIYEFLPNGSLDHWLYNNIETKMSHSIRQSSSVSSSSSSSSSGYLDWETRIKIMKGVAHGLAFLHGLESPIVHRDIKASNVLLGQDFEAHIADFGLARWIDGANSHVSTQVAGTMGYMPPEYKAGLSAATVKADAYSFGVLMFEVASGRRPSWPFKEEGEGNEEMRLVEWAKKKVAAGKATEIVDKEIPGREEVVKGMEKEVMEFARIADLCTREKPKERPAMAECVEMLSALCNGDCVIRLGAA